MWITYLFPFKFPSAMELANLFLGRFEHSIDAKGRIAIPAKFREGLPEGQPLNEEVIYKFKEEYKALKEKRIERLSALYPQYVNADSEFTGRLGAGAIEGLASRVKYFMGVPYKVVPSFLGRVVAFALVDSIYTFRRGEAKESFAHRKGSFKWEDVMDCPRTVEDPLIKMFQGWNPDKFHRFSAE